MALPLSTRAGGFDVLVTHWNEVINALNGVWNGSEALENLTITGKATGSAPASAPAGKMRLYYDTTLERLMLSRDSGPFFATRMLLQNVVKTTQTEDTTASSSYADTSLSQSFTPISDDSDIVIFGAHNGIGPSDPALSLWLRLNRDANQLVEFVTNAECVDSNSNVLGWSAGFAHIEPSPGGLSAVTYKTQFRRSPSGSIRLQQDGSGTTAQMSWMVILEIL